MYTGRYNILRNEPMDSENLSLRLDRIKRRCMAERIILAVILHFTAIYASISSQLISLFVIDFF